MRNKRAIQGIIFLILAVALVVATIPQQSVSAKSDLVRLTIKNNSDKPVTMKLTGPAYYYFYVKPGQTAIYTPQRGVYDYTFTSCGTSLTGELDLSRHKTMDVPPCGSKASTGDGPDDTVDVGDVLKLVRVTLENKTGHNIIIILRGPSEYAFFLYEDDSKDYTITKGEYTYWLYGCGGIKTGKVYAEPHKVKELTCK
jgi:hypothetical protein